jgi:hypothetical protein
MQAQRRLQKKLWQAHRRLSLSTIPQRCPRALGHLDWIDLDCLFGGARLVGETRIGLATCLLMVLPFKSGLGGACNH